jgi:hypothetical protein
MLSGSWRATSAKSAGLLPVLTTYLGPHTAAGFTARTWRTTNQSNSIHTAASHKPGAIVLSNSTVHTANAEIAFEILETLIPAVRYSRVTPSRRSLRLYQKLTNVSSGVTCGLRWARRSILFRVVASYSRPLLRPVYLSESKRKRSLESLGGDSR